MGQMASSRPPPITAGLFTMATIPPAADYQQQFIQVSDVSGVGVGLMYSDGATWRSIAFTAQRVRVQTNSNGLYTWTYQVPFAAGVVPKIFSVAEAPAGSTDIFLAKLKSASGDLLWGKRFGDAVAQSGKSVAVDGMGSVVLWSRMKRFRNQ